MYRKFEFEIYIFLKNSSIGLKQQRLFVKENMKDIENKDFIQFSVNACNSCIQWAIIVVLSYRYT